MKLAKYKTSRDYRELWTIAHECNVACVVYTVFRRGFGEIVWGGDCMYIYAEGTCYSATLSTAAFETAAAELNLEWLVPLRRG